MTFDHLEILIALGYVFLKEKNKVRHQADELLISDWFPIGGFGIGSAIDPNAGIRLYDQAGRLLCPPWLPKGGRDLFGDVSAQRCG